MPSRVGSGMPAGQVEQPQGFQGVAALARAARHAAGVGREAETWRVVEDALVLLLEGADGLEVEVAFTPDAAQVRLRGRGAVLRSALRALAHRTSRTGQ